MKTLKLISLVMLMLGLCSGQVQADCECGIGINGSARYVSGPLAGQQVTSTNPAHVGDEIYYRVTVYSDVTNCALENVTAWIIFPDGSPCDLPDTPYLEIDGSETYESIDVGCTYIVRAEDVGKVEAGYVVGDVYDHGYCIGVPDDADGHNTISSPVVSNPNTKVTIEVSPDTGPIGFLATLTIKEENTGEEPLTNVRVELYADTHDGAGEVFLAILDETTASGDDGDGILEPGTPGETWSWYYPVNVFVHTTYVVYGYGTDALLGEVSFYTGYPDERAEDDATPECPEPCIEITKSVDCDVSKVGDTVTYMICIENCGNYDLTGIKVTDDILGDISDAFPDTLSPQDGQVCEYFPYKIKPEDDPGDFPYNVGNTVVNQAHVSGIDDCDGETVVTGDSEKVSVLLMHPCIDLQVECASTGPVLPGEYAEFTVTFTNCGDVDLLLDFSNNWGSCQFTDKLVEAFSDPIVYHPSALVPEDFVDTQICLEAVVDWDIADDLDGCLLNEGTIIKTGCCPIGREGCRLTGGGVDEEDSILPVASSVSLDNDRIQFGGQAGANTALPPQPKGEWTHHQQRGPSGKFTFHGGTASAPLGTEIIEIRCSDPGGCKPSGDPPSPCKQVDFDGIGTFKNFGKAGTDREPTWPDASVEVIAECSSKGGKFRFDGTFHYFEVNADDNGEPGNQIKSLANTDTCPPLGFGEKSDPTADPADEFTNCDCPDFYRITIYNGVKADTEGLFLPDGNIDLDKLPKGPDDVIYEFHGYLDGGNLQIHHLTGYDLNLSYHDTVNLNLLAESWLEGV